MGYLLPDPCFDTGRQARREDKCLLCHLAGLIAAVADLGAELGVAYYRLNDSFTNKNGRHILLAGWPSGGEDKV